MRRTSGAPGTCCSSTPTNSAETLETVQRTRFSAGHTACTSSPRRAPGSSQGLGHTGGLAIMRRVLKFLVLTAALAVVCAPAAAHAEGYVSPWVAANAGTRFGDFDNGRAGFGVNAGGMGKGVIGGELGFGFSPSFFGTKNDFGSNSVIDLMGNVIVGVPLGGTRGAGIRPVL